MRPVRFLSGCDAGRSHYLTGEVAAFPEAEAARLVRFGKAEYADGAPTLEAAPKAEAATPTPSSTTATGAASISAALVPEDAPPSPAVERRDVLADSVSRPPTRAERRAQRKG